MKQSFGVPQDVDVDVDLRDDAHAVWQLETRCGAFLPEWRLVYQFSETELCDADTEVFAFAVAQRPWHGIFWMDVLAIKFFVVGDAAAAMERVRSGEVRVQDLDLGRLTLSAGKIKRRVGDTIEVVKVVNSEQERVAALKEYFNITVREEDIGHIEGRAAAFTSKMKSTLDFDKF